MYNGILLGHKKMEILPFATTWMDFESIVLSKVSQRKQILHDHFYMESKNKTNEQIADNKSETVINRYREQTDGC